MNDGTGSTNGLGRRAVLRTLAATGVAAGLGGRVAGSTTTGDSFSATDDSFPATEFQRTYGGDGEDLFNAVLPVEGGGALVAGKRTDSADGTAEGWLVRLNGDGDVDWERRYGSDDGGVRFANLVEASDGYLAVGQLSSPSGSSDPNRGYAVKVDGSGSVDWTHADPEGSTQYLGGVATGDGSYFVAGSDSSSSTFSATGMTLELTGSGDVAWRETYDGTFFLQSALPAAGSADASYVLSGSTGFPVVGSGTGIVLGVDDEGTEQWRTSVAGDGSAFFFRGTRVTDPDGYVFAGGTSTGSEAVPVPLLVRTDASGTVRWSNTYGSDGGALLSAEPRSGGGIAAYGATGKKLVGGSADSSGLVLHADADGSEVDSGSVEGDGVGALTDGLGARFAAGYTASGGDLSGRDGWAVKFADGSDDDPPTVDAGTDLVAEAGESVELTATASDPDGDSLSYSWSQTAGTAVSLSDADTASPAFTAPDVDAVVDLTFEVTVDDGSATATDTVTVTVAASAVDVADEDGDGDIDDSELRSAIVDWSSGRFDDDDLRDVIVEWSS